MNTQSNRTRSRIANIIENRSPAGQQDSVQGWHKMLQKFLNKMEPYLIEGQLVTFQNLLEQEKDVFENLHQKITVPPSIVAIYMPPSVRHQMMYQIN